MIGTPSLATLSPASSAQESVLQDIKKNHPLFQPGFSADDWVENHGVWTLTEAAITLAVAEYQNSIESHNTRLTTQITLGEEEIAKLREELTGLVTWDKKKRGEITAALGGLKSDLRGTKSDTVRGDLNTQIGALEGQLTTMAADRDRRKVIEEQVIKLLTTEKTSAGKKIAPSQQASLAEDLQGALNDISIHVQKPIARLVAAPSSKSFLGSTRGQVSMTVCALLLGAGVALWNIRDQIKKGEEPVNLIERLLQGSKPKNEIPSPINADASADFYRQAAIMFMRDKITSAKNETLAQISQDGNIQGLSARLKTNIEKAFAGQPGEVVIKENKGESGCPIFTIMFTQGKNTYIESMGTSEIFNSIDTWITNQLIANHFKGDMATVMLAESYSNQPVQTREIVIQSIAQSSLAVTFDKKMEQNGYQLNTTDSGIIWDPATGRPAFKIVYFFGNPAAQQVLVKPFAQLP